MTKIIKTYVPKEILEGAGVLVNRVFGYYETKEFDPFLMLDYFDIEKGTNSPGFPWHPHRGIETITYFLRGSGRHEDSMGNSGVIKANELQWMSAGSGIYHQEMPEAKKDGVKGFQFWLNLSADNKMKTPEYEYINQGEMKMIENESGIIKVISGKYKNIDGPINKEELGVTMLHIFIKKDREISLTRAKEKQGFIFVFKGSGKIESEDIEAVKAYTLSEGNINIKSKTDLEFIYAEGRPLKEPIAWRGPVVMNTEEELKETFKELNEGTFIKSR